MIKRRKTSLNIVVHLRLLIFSLHI